METQANAPAPAQAQQPVHPIHQETQTLEALTKWVSDNPDNDPHEGTDLEAPKAPVEQTAEEPKDQPQEPQAAEGEFDEETPFFELDYNGEKKKLNAKELREGWLAKQDYHRNIQKVKQQEAEIQQKVQQAQLQAAQQYVQQIEMHKQAIQKLAGVKSMQEIEALSREDPAAAQQEFLRLINVNQTYQALEAQQRQAQEQLQRAHQTARQQAVEKARQTLQSDIPGWGEELYGKVLSSMVQDYGLSKEGVTQVAEAELIKVFHDAFQYRQLQRAKPEVSKRVVAVPKVIKPGSAEKPNPASEASQELASKFRKSGDWRDAASLYLARSKKK